MKNPRIHRKHLLALLFCLTLGASPSPVFASEETVSDIVYSEATSPEIEALGDEMMQTMKQKASKKQEDSTTRAAASQKETAKEKELADWVRSISKKIEHGFLNAARIVQNVRIPYSY